jgi:hypothetical protein
LGFAVFGAEGFVVQFLGRVFLVDVSVVFVGLENQECAATLSFDGAEGIPKLGRGIFTRLPLHSSCNHLGTTAKNGLCPFVTV